jgi:hypothetical protein
MTNEQRIEDIYKGVQDIKIELAKSIVRQEQHRAEIDEHEDRITILDAYKNKTLGIVGLIGVFFGVIAGWLVHILTK